MHLTSALLSGVPGIRHGFGSFSEPVPGSFQATWDRDFPRCHQTHGTGVVEVRAAAQECGQADALFSRTPGAWAAVKTADCVPILLARRDGAAVAAVHAGWRGTRARILRALWERLARDGERAADWVAAIGPAIGPCCYEVSPELAADFEREFAGFRESRHGAAVPRSRHLDLQAVNAAQCDELGIGAAEILRACTRCAVDDRGPRFHSFRREGSGTRQWSAIARLTCSN